MVNGFSRQCNTSPLLMRRNVDLPGSINFLGTYFNSFRRRRRIPLKSITRAKVALLQGELFDTSDTTPASVFPNPLLDLCIRQYPSLSPI